MSKTWGFFFGGSEHGSESSCQISAYYKFFPGKSYFYRTNSISQAVICGESGCVGEEVVQSCYQHQLLQA